jgi:preprotein translocase subunit SecB
MAESDVQTSPGEVNSVAIQTQKIYVKDISFETPDSPAIFTKEWTPTLTVDLGQKVIELAEDLYEVVLTLTATMKTGDSTAYLTEVQQAGIFIIKGLGEEKLMHVLNVYCPRSLYPYACSAASEIVTRGGFPQLLLAPVNFKAIYHKRMEKAGTGDGDG